MPPHLTETWASAYLQILIGTLFFALGIPAFILQLVVHEDIRHVTEGRIQTKWWSRSIWLIGVASVSFVWLLHPRPNEEMAKWKDWVACLIVTLVPLGAAYFGLKFLGQFKRESVVQGLTAMLTRKYSTTQESRYEKALKDAYHKVLRFAYRTLLKIGYRSRDLPEKDLFQDLKYLGERGKPGPQKQLVLNAYSEIVSAVQNSSEYKGGELDYLIRSLHDILENQENSGDGENYNAAAELLKSILATHSKLNHSSPNHLVDLDADAVIINALTDLALTSIKSQRDPTVVRILNIGASCSSSIVFKMGLSALRAKRFLIATYALNRLEAEVETETAAIHDGVMMPCDATFRLLGVISHFVTAGGAARARAQVFFRNQDPRFLSHLDECLREAFDDHYSRTDFETADNIAALRNLTSRADGTTRQKKKERLANYSGLEDSRMRPWRRPNHESA